jgi:hypothetical protein
MIIAINTNKTLKFYDFIDKRKRAEEEEKEKVLQDLKKQVPGFNTKLRKLFEIYDTSKTGVLIGDDMNKMLNDLIDLYC